MVNAPISELLKYMDSSIKADNNKRKEKQAEMYINYLSQIFSQPLQDKPSSGYVKAKQEFEKLLMPDNEDEKTELKEPKKNKGWDFDPSKYEDYIELSE